MQDNRFGELLRDWRNVKGYSQLELSLAADVSSKHLSFLETGKSQPSREMVLLLAQILELNMDACNVLLELAGFKPRYQKTDLASEAMTQVRLALELLIKQQEPFPTTVMDRFGNILMLNEAAIRMLGLFLPPEKMLEYTNVYHLYIDPDGMQPYIQNWDLLVPKFLLHLQHEVMSSEDPEGERIWQQIMSYPHLPKDWKMRAVAEVSNPIVDVTMEKGEKALRFFTTLITFGSPQDLTLQHIRIESFFPSDDVTRAFLEEMRDNVG